MSALRKQLESLLADLRAKTPEIAGQLSLDRHGCALGYRVGSVVYVLHAIPRGSLKLLDCAAAGNCPVVPVEEW
jgi:hypothetical protein